MSVALPLSSYSIHSSDLSLQEEAGVRKIASFPQASVVLMRAMAWTHGSRNLAAEEQHAVFAALNVSEIIVCTEQGV